MGFSSEEEMKKVALESLKGEFIGESGIILDEFSYANGRADIVLAKASEDYLKRRTTDLGISSAIDRDSYLQTFLQLHGRGPITKDYFYSIGALDKSTKKKALEWLQERGFVKELEHGKIRTAPNLRRHITTSYSVELKLKNWKTALEQATRGKSFSDYQFVALDEENILRAQENIEIFREKEIGLMEISSNGDYHVYYHPEKQNPYSPMNKWRLNETTIREEVPHPISSD